MERPDQIWPSYEDFELAFALHYKGHTLSVDESQSLYSEIARRGLTSVGLRVLINAKLSITVEGYDMRRCPRCTSYKIKPLLAEELPQAKNELSFAEDTTSTYVEHYICEVCDYNVSTHLAQKKQQRNQKLSIALVLIMMLVMLLIVLL